MSTIKDKKKLIIALCGVVLILLVLSLIKRSYSMPTTESNKINERIETYYDVPIISLINTNNKSIIVKAGYYRYGDVIQDGEIDEYDISALKKHINNENSLDNNSLILSDINNDGEVNSIDLNYLEDYLKTRVKVEYNTMSNSLYYCLNKDNNLLTCDWKDSNKIDVTEEQKYYIFVKDKNNNNKSNVYEYTHIVNNYEELSEKE